MLKLVNVKHSVETVPAAFREGGAAKYLCLSRTRFRNLVFSGLIPYTSHQGSFHRIYLRADLDNYLNSLPRRKIPSSETRSPERSELQ